MAIQKLLMVIEKNDNELLGRLVYKEDLIVEYAKDVLALEDQMKKLLFKFYKVSSENIKFQYKYDLSVLFDTFSYLKISTVAEIAGLNPSLLRQYVTGKKQASANQAKRIEETIHKLGKELAGVRIYVND